MATFTGTSSADLYTGGGDSDQITGNGGNDSLSGNGGNDDIAGGAGADTLDGGDGSDILYSGARTSTYNLPYYSNPFTPPTLDTGSEADVLRGGSGDDRIFAGYGDSVDGGSQNYGDYLFISFLGAPTGVTVDFRLASQTVGGATIEGIESISWVQGSNFDDDINVASGSYNGYSDFTAVFGAGGNDRLVAGYYTGVLYGEDGNDVLDGRGSQYLQRVDGGAGNDTLYTNSNTFGAAYGGTGNDTIYAHGEVHGGSGDDRIEMQTTYYTGTVYGDEGNDTILAVAAGNPNGYGNTIAGGSGADTIVGGANNDRLISGDLAVEGGADTGLERDSLVGGGGDDRLVIGYGDNADGGIGTDTLNLWLAGATSGISIDLTGITGPASFTFAGGTISGFEIFERLTGSAFADTITVGTQAGLAIIDGGAGADVVISGGSSVEFNGGAGDDRFVSGRAGDTFRGGDGFDTVDYSQYSEEISVSLVSGTGPGGDSPLDVEQVIGTALADTISGGAVAESLVGGGGNDSLAGGGGSDTLSGGTGNDVLDGGLGGDRMAGDAGNDSYSVDSAEDRVLEAAGGGTDMVTSTAASWILAAGQEVETLAAGGSGAVDLTGNEFANRLNGNAAANLLSGQAGNDVLNGGDGNDTLDGGLGNDQMAGGAGDDVYHVDGLSDVVTEDLSAGTDTVIASIAYTLGQNVENLILSAGVAFGTGNGLDNQISGNSQGNSLSGGGGNDTLDGGGEADTLSGGAGHDALLGGDGMDILSGDDGNDHLFGQSPNGGLDGADSLEGGAGSDYLQGNAGNDTLDGGLGSDRINGGANDDLIRGGNDNGSDTINGNLGNDTIEGGAGNDSLRGGQGDDSILGGDGNDLLYGDRGADTLSGGAGVDFFLFGDSSALFNGPGADVVADFEDGIDRLQVSHAILAVLTGVAQTSFAAAATMAQNMFDGHAGNGEAAAIMVGGDTYIFYSNDNGQAVDSAIRLVGIDVQSIGSTDFI